MPHHRLEVKKNYLYTKSMIFSYSKKKLSHQVLIIIIQKKKVRFAVNRNLFRRIIKEFFRLNIDTLYNFDFVVLTNLSDNTTRRSLWDALKSFLVQFKLLC